MDGAVSLEQVITEVQVLRLRPGDVLVLKSSRLLASDGSGALHRTAETVSKFVGFRVSALVVPDDADLQVLRSSDAPWTHQRDLDATAAMQPVPMMPAGAAYNVIKAHAKCSVCQGDMLPAPQGGFQCNNGHQEP